MESSQVCAVFYGSFCGDVQSSRALLQQHKKAKHLTCCGKQYRSMSGLRSHTQAAHGSAGVDLQCTQCGKTYSDRGALIRHVRSVHERQKRFMCLMCGEGFVYGHSLRRHLTNEHKPHDNGGTQDVASSKCEVCGVMLRGSHAGHMWVVHGRNTSGKRRRLLKCDVCGQRVVSKMNLLSHMNKHTGERSFKCSTCGAMFKQRSSLSKHSKLHSNDKEFKCAYCDQAFARKSYLQQHERLHTGEKPFKCNLCERRFAQKTSLNVHEKNQHGIQKQQQQQQHKKQTQPKCHRQKKSEAAATIVEPNGAAEVTLDLTSLSDIHPDREIAAAEILCNMETDVISSGSGGGSYLTKSPSDEPPVILSTHDVITLADDDTTVSPSYQLNTDPLGKPIPDAKCYLVQPVDQYTSSQPFYPSDVTSLVYEPTVADSNSLAVVSPLTSAVLSSTSTTYPQLVPKTTSPFVNLLPPQVTVSVSTSSSADAEATSLLHAPICQSPIAPTVLPLSATAYVVSQPVSSSSFVPSASIDTDAAQKSQELPTVQVLPSISSMQSPLTAGATIVYRAKDMDSENSTGIQYLSFMP